MSKHETWRTRKYWREVGGLLIEEFHAIKGDKKQDIGKRAIDGVIVLGEENAIQTGGRYEFTRKDLIVVQTKSGRLGMYLMGQAYFSREIMDVTILVQSGQLRSADALIPKWRRCVLKRISRSA